MPIRVAVPKEIADGERRVAVTPDAAERLCKAGVELAIERGAGESAFFPDSDYDDVRFVDSAAELYAQADVVLKVQPPTETEIGQLREGTMVIGFMQPHRFPERVKLLRDRSITALAMELVPRISRAQSMDALSSQANIAGYKGALMAADLSAQFFPMLTTAAGTIRPAKVLVIGAGVAGLQAIATARRLGAMVEAYDVRKATKEQVQSLGAKFLELTVDAQADGGYARELTEAEKHHERDMLADHVAAANAVISTAAIPGRPSPKLVTADMVTRMRPGSVIIDLAAEGGGNCELSKPGETMRHDNGVIIHAPLNVPAMLPVHASEMYARNLFNLLKLMISENNELTPDWNDEVLAGSTLTRDRSIRHEASRKLVEGEGS